MKSKIIWTMAIVCIMFVQSPSHGNAQTTVLAEKKNALSLDVLSGAALAIVGAMSGTVNVPVFINYQRVIFDHFTVSIIPFLNYWGLEGGWAFRLMPWAEADWHPFDKGLNGLFLGFAAVGSIDLDSRPNMANSYFLGLAPVVGYQFLLPWNLDLDFAFGLAFGERFGTDGSADFGAYRSRIEIGFGYRF